MAETTDSIGIPWDPAAVGLYNGWIDEGKVPFIELWGVYSATKSISPSTVQGIVDIVRTKALELALDLQAEFPDAGEVGGPTINEPAVQEAVTHITNNIYGPVNGFAQGNKIRQNLKVKTGDLVGALLAAKTFLSDEAITEFSKILTDPNSEDEKRSKLGQFVQGIKSGTFAVSSGVASNIAAEGVMELANQFFGWASGVVG